VLPQWCGVMLVPAGVDVTATALGVEGEPAIGQSGCAAFNQQDRSQVEAASQVVAIRSDSNVANGLAIVRIE
jgi:hypothetical protein